MAKLANTYQYEFLRNSKATDNPIKLTLDGKGCSMALLDSLDGKTSFMQLGAKNMLRGRALKEYEALAGKGVQ